MNTTTPKNSISLWFNKDAEQAARFYAATFPDSEVTAVHLAPGDYPSGKAGEVGYCLGGRMSFALGASGAVSAAVSYYGVALNKFFGSEHGARTLVHVAQQDTMCPPAAQLAIVEPSMKLRQSVCALRCCMYIDSRACALATWSAMTWSDRVTSSAAIDRATEPMFRSRLRTPASRVYPSIIHLSASSLNFTWLRVSPFASSWRGTR